MAIMAAYTSIPTKRIFLDLASLSAIPDLLVVLQPSVLAGRRVEERTSAAQ
jgi:hypothetical protein